MTCGVSVEFFFQRAVPMQVHPGFILGVERVSSSRVSGESLKLQNNDLEAAARSDYILLASFYLCLSDS